jgi:hypothetical protein
VQLFPPQLWERAHQFKIATMATVVSTPKEIAPIVSKIVLGEAGSAREE